MVNLNFLNCTAIVKCLAKRINHFILMKFIYGLNACQDLYQFT